MAEDKLFASSLHHQIDTYLRHMELLVLEPIRVANGILFCCERHMSNRECLDSDNLSIRIARDFIAAGRRVRFKVVSQSKDAEFHHVYVEVWYEDLKQWIPIDPHQCKGFGGSSERFGKELLGRPLEG